MSHGYIGHLDLSIIQERCDAAVTAITPEQAKVEDRTRQELAADCDLNILLRRYEPYELPVREAFYGHRDYDLDAHDAALASRRALEKWNSLDDAVKSHFASFGAFLNSYEDVITGVEAGTGTVPAGDAGTAAPSKDAAAGDTAGASVVK